MSNEAIRTRVTLERGSPLSTLRIASDSGVNIFSTAVVSELGERIGSLERDGECRVVALRGVGKTFVAGADIKEMAPYQQQQGEAFSKNGHRVFDALAALPQVTIAAMNGHAMGGGLELALACDFRILVAGAKIGLPECRLGLIPGWGGTQRLPKLVGLANARRMMFSGEALEAEDAKRIGLVDEVVASAEELDAAIARWVALVKPAAPQALSRIKHALQHDDEVRQFAIGFGTSEATEGMTAFIEKRAAAWAR